MEARNKYDLIGEIISLINSVEYKATITNMSRDCNVPKPYMRKAMLAVIRNLVLQSCLYTNDDSRQSEEDSSFIEEYLDTPSDISTDLLKGAYDDIEWRLNMRTLDANEDEILTLSHIEVGAIKLMNESILSIKRGALFEIKETTNPISAEVRKTKNTILDAIENKAAVSFIYKNRQNITERVKCYPLEVFTNINDNWVYFRAEDSKLYRLDRIIHGCKVLKEPIEHSFSEPISNLKYAWGSYYKKGESPVHVIVRIIPETRNIIQKIKSDTKYRNQTGKFFQKGEYYYYEDDIIGLDEFQRWVRGYGSSIVVIAPENLKNLIVERAHQTLDLYNASKEWGAL